VHNAKHAILAVMDRNPIYKGLTFMCPYGAPLECNTHCDVPEKDMVATDKCGPPFQKSWDLNHGE